MMRFCLILVVTLSLACEHSAPFREGSYAPDSAVGTPPFIRLTINPGTDLTPAWARAGDKILYTAERLDRLDKDLCLAVFPLPGATISQYFCRTTTPDDSVNAFRESAISDDGRIAYVRASARLLPVRPIAPDAQALVVATLDHVNDAQVLRTIGYIAPSGRLHQSVSHIGWLGPTRLVYLGESVTYPRPCGTCPADTIRTGLEIVTLDFSSSPTIETVPATDSATSLAVGSTGDTIYYTRATDSRLYRHTFSSAKTDTVRDFAPRRWPRAVQVRGSRLYIVLDGRLDIGGDLHIVDLVTGTDIVPPFPASNRVLWHQRLALSPDGNRLLTESRIIEINVVSDPPSADTIAPRPTDIWVYELP